MYFSWDKFPTFLTLQLMDDFIENMDFSAIIFLCICPAIILMIIPIKFGICGDFELFLSVYCSSLIPCYHNFICVYLVSVVFSYTSHHVYFVGISVFSYLKKNPYFHRSIQKNWQISRFDDINGTCHLGHMALNWLSTAYFSEIFFSKKKRNKNVVQNVYCMCIS